jgi:hypothetical protein
VLSAALPFSGDVAAKDGAARGLDLFLHAPDEVLSGGSLPVQARVYGFPTVTTLAPLAGATVEATWDPESLAEGKDKPVASVPPAVATVSDGAGRAHLEIPVPSGSGKLKLLVAARWQGHERVRTLEVSRLPRYELDLRASDTQVVPGGTIAAWMLVRDRVTGRPAAHMPVELVLSEGSVSRGTRRLRTDVAGVVSTEVRIPAVDDPDWHWNLTARTVETTGEHVEATLSLGVREETPQAPTLAVRWKTNPVRPGDVASLLIELRDGNGKGLARLPLRYWVGPKGTQAPAEDGAWLAASKPAQSDVDGRAILPIETPRTVAPRGTTMTALVRTSVDGQALSAQAVLTLATPAPEVRLWSELGSLLPGHAQRLFVRATLEDRPIVGELILEGHDLSAKLTTNARGWAETTWAVPVDLGAKVPDGAPSECAGQVAATVRVRWLSAVAGLGSDAPPRPITRCLVVDRDAVAAVRPEKSTVVAGQPLAVRLLGGKGSASVLLKGDEQGSWSSAWLPDASRGDTVTTSPAGRGEWAIGAAGLDLGKAKAKTKTTTAGTVLEGKVLVLPPVLPRLRAKRADDAHVAPGSKVALDMVLDDGQGRPLTGSVGAVVFDKNGGGHPENLLALDTRRSLAAGVGLDDQDVDAFLAGDPAFDIERRAGVVAAGGRLPKPAFDPVATHEEEREKAFREIVQSLEGAIYEASADPEQLRDVRIRTSKGTALNPELMTLVTEAMSEAPVTPGGEPWTLADLMAIDPQVKFDPVARRVTRLKLFQLLSAVRTFLFEDRIGMDEPILRDPNALLRRMVRDEKIEASALLDPWGHGMSFVRSSGPRIPFLSMVPGYRLVSAGPDGKLGTGDDVRDPFDRVLASRTPYAKAVSEDRLVDARWDMRVGDGTVEAWHNLLTEVTGRELGDQAENVMGGLVGNEIGEGYGVGGVGLHGGHSARNLDVGSARWLPPVRTDAQGRARLTVPVGDAETTWQIVLVAIPDDGLPATASVEVPTVLPLSVRVDTGAAWTVGDQVDVSIRVRNRTDKPLAARLHLSASGGAALLDPKAAEHMLTVPANSATELTVAVAGASVGTGALEATVDGGGLADRLRHAWAIRPAGETVLAQNLAWIDGGDKATIPLPSATESTPAGPGRLVVERGIEPALAAALESLTSERLVGDRAYADAMESFGRIGRWAVAAGGERQPLAVRARELAQQVSERAQILRERKGKGVSEDPLVLREQEWQAVAVPGKEKPTPTRKACPSITAPPLPAALDWLELAPRAGRTEAACWVTLRASAISQLAQETDPRMLARAVLLFAEWPSQAQVTTSLASRLAAAVHLKRDGSIALPEAYVADRSAAVLIWAALVRTSTAAMDGKPAEASRLWSRLLVERDVHGGYGSSEATRQVVMALLRKQSATGTAAPIRVIELSSKNRTLAQTAVQLGTSGAQTVPLSPDTVAVRLESPASGVLARAVRPILRSFRRPDSSRGPLLLDVSLGGTPVAGTVSAVQVTLRQDVGRALPVQVRIPLPPGATLAEKTQDVRQVQGALYLHEQMDADTLPRVLQIPLRFALAGRLLMPEATATVTDEEFPPARAPARPIVVQAR